ncbi:MAG: UDP-N-acetylmuramoyl-L-alanine--D-glutamate ligase [Polyangiaceae bacterium]|nr:UDP-N-acetylmuramoyl-L-alanine--D-glutamate ligase [Polyangiaceae bacterium]
MSNTFVKDQQVVVIGLGKSGVAAARLCARHGARVIGTDAAPLERLSADARALQSEGIEVVAGRDPAEQLGRASLVVISPGVPSFAALDAAEKSGIPVIGEIELAARFLPDVPVIAITGSNGKSTTVTLVGELLAALGAKPFVGGNLGDPPCAVVPQPGGPERFDYNAVVLEISSFQAERIPTFRPRRAALLNVSPNHLDRYAGFDEYVAAKGNLFVHQTKDDAAVVPADDLRCLAQARRGGAQILPFGNDAHADAVFAFDKESIIDRRRGIRYPRSRIRIPGDHNALNICASLALLDDRAPDPEIVGGVLERFEGLPHRIVLVAKVAGVSYYDDSKGTNVGATVAAVRGLAESRVVLIAGGRDKLGSYDPLVAALRDRGRGAVLIGEAADRIADAIGGAVAVERASSMEEAVESAARLAQPGDAVLLSPACSSFDMFRDYKHRGDAFVDAVAKLPQS